MVCNQKVMNLFAIYGAGLLVGAALIVIIPEGIGMLIMAMTDKDLIHRVNELEHGEHNHQHEMNETNV